MVMELLVNTLGALKRSLVRESESFRKLRV
jgi:hypothetical protein